MNLRLLAAASAALLASAAASAALAAPQATASADAAINVTVMAPASIAKVTDMAIGTIVRPATGTSNVALNPDTGAVTTDGTGQHAGLTTAAKFHVTGPTGTSFTASTALGATDTVKNLTGFTVTASSSNPTTIGASGSDLLYGATFAVADTTTAQAYSGTLTVTINYP